MNSGKSRTSSRRLPGEARVRRAARTKGKRSLLTAFALPVGAVLLGIAVVYGVGYWLQHRPPTEEPKDTAKSGAPATSTPAPATTPPATTQPPQVSTPKPAETQPKPDPNQAILAARSHIDRSGGAKETMLVTAYYVDGLKEAESLQPVQILVARDPAVARVTAEQVVQAPENWRLFSNVPAGTKVNSVALDTKTGILKVDLSSEVQKIRGSAAVVGLQHAFVYSLTEITGVKSVQLLVTGRPALLDQLEWSRPVGRADLAASSGPKVEAVVKFVKP